MIEDYKLIKQETIELTAALLGGTKREESRPVSKEREAKRKASEPCIDISDLEEDKSTTAISGETVKKMMQKMEEAMQSMKYRTDDLSSLEQSYSSVSMEMTAVKNAMEKMSTTFSQMNEENQKRDQKINDAISQINVDIRTLDWKTEGQITTFEKKMDTKIEETVCKEFGQKKSPYWKRR